jgi:hypothetical protein
VTLTFDLCPFWCHHITYWVSLYVYAKFGGDPTLISPKIPILWPNNVFFCPSWPWPLTFDLYDASMFLPECLYMYVPSLVDIPHWLAEKLSILCPKMAFLPLVTLTFDLWPFRCFHVPSLVSIHVCAKFGGDLPYSLDANSRHTHTDTNIQSNRSRILNR